MTAQEMSFGDLLDAVATAIPERRAIIYGDQTITWQKFDRRSNRLARYLIEAGLKPGSKVAFYLRNTPAYPLLLAACFKARLTHVNVNYRYTNHELFHVLDNSDAEAIVFDSEFLPHINALKPRLSDVKLFLEHHEKPGKQAQVSSSPDSLVQAHSFEQACSQGDGSTLKIKRSGDDLYFMYTGGTTGYPKAVMWRHKDRIEVIGMSDAADPEEHARQVAANPLPPVTLPAAPLMHSTGFTSTVSTLVRGGCLVLLPAGGFDPQQCLEQIEKHKVRQLAIVGDAFSVPLLDALKGNQSFQLNSVALINSAGAMWSERCKLGLLEYFTEATLSDSLGASEGSRLGASTMRRGEMNATAAFMPGPAVKFFTEDFREIAKGSGEAGMIAKAGPLPLGYYKDPEATAKTFPTIEGVRYSMAGDWCRLEADGTMTLLGRGNNCINTGGEKVYPEEVEEALKTMPEIADAAVIGQPDERWGQSVASLIITQDGSDITMEKIREHLEPLLARYKHPRIINFTTQAIRHENGKMHYRAVKQIFEQAQTTGTE